MGTDLQRVLSDRVLQINVSNFFSSVAFFLKMPAVQDLGLTSYCMWYTVVIVP